MIDPDTDDCDDYIEEPDNESAFEDEHPPVKDEDDEDDDDTDDDAEAEADADDDDDDDNVEAEADTLADDGLPVAPPTARFLRLGDVVLEYKHWMNPRLTSGLDNEKLRVLAATIAARTVDTEESTIAGIREPLEIVMIKGPNGETINLAIDGQRRHMAAHLAYGKGADDVLVPVVDREPEPVDWTPELAAHYLLEVLEIPGTREGLSSYELAQSVVRLRGQRDHTSGKEYTLAAIAAKIGRSESWVSKILKALDSASPTLVASWRRAEITDEQFKHLASQRNVVEQAKATEKVVAARQAGDKATSRVLAAEQKEAAKATRAREKEKEKEAKEKSKTKGKEKTGKEKTAVRGPQIELAKGAKIDAKVETLPAPPARKPPSFAVVEDFLSTAEARPPTHDYVKGLMDGARWAVGLMDAAGFGKPWQSYMALVAGRPGGRSEGKAKKPAKKR